MFTDKNVNEIRPDTDKLTDQAKAKATSLAEAKLDRAQQATQQSLAKAIKIAGTLEGIKDKAALADNLVSPGLLSATGTPGSLSDLTSDPMQHHLDRQFKQASAQSRSLLTDIATGAIGGLMAAESNPSGLQFTLKAANLPDTTFAVAAFDLQESLSMPFVLTVDLASADANLDFGAILDEEATLTVWNEGQPARSVTGIVAGFEQGDTGFHRTRYQMVIRPAFWRTTLRKNSRIFQEQTLLQILDTLLKENGNIRYKTTHFKHAHPPREFCVQYQESDFDFIQRLTAEEGIFYYFEFDANSTTLVFTDNIAGIKPAAESIPYNPNKNAQANERIIHTFRRSEQVRTAQVELQDYTFKHPNWEARFKKQASDLQHQRNQYEHFEFPGRFKDEQHGKDFTLYALEALRNDAQQGTGESNQFALQPGVKFNLAQHPRQDLNRDWQIVGIHHIGRQPQALEEEGGSEGTTLTNQFSFIPDSQTWRPSLLPKPKVDGPQIAVVVGPPNEEIWTDEHGRVRLKFLWDRYTTNDDKSSCWIRVSQPLAGKGWGMITIPRIGQEVIVDFLHGDPDQPVVTGRTYHANSKTSLGLPAAKTQTTLRSQTHKGGGFNELKFEDEDGKQELFMHAQKDMNTTVLNNRSTNVNASHTENVGDNQTITIGENQTITVSANHALSVQADHNVIVGGGKKTLVEGAIVTASATGIRLACGDTAIVLDNAGNINLICKNFNIFASENGQISTGKILDLNMSGGAAGTEAGPEPATIADAVQAIFSK